jgi:hypothetical protein
VDPKQLKYISVAPERNGFGFVVGRVGQITKIEMFVRNKGFSEMKNAIKNSLLITAAVATLAAGANLVLAQGVNERRDVPAAAAPAQKAPEGKVEQKGVGPQKVESPKPAPNAQAPAKVNPAPLAQAPEKAAPAPHAQGSETTKPVTTGQAPDKAHSAPAAQGSETTKPVTTGQAPDKAHPAPTTQAPEKATPSSTPQNAQAPNKGAAPNAAAERGSKSDTSVVLSSDQHVKIREMLRGENNERLTNVSFSISVGQAIPQTVHLYTLPLRIVEYVPQYRGYDYFLVGDEILIVDPVTLRIVAVIPV